MTTAEVCRIIEAEPKALRKFLDRHEVGRKPADIGGGTAKQIDALAFVAALKKTGRTDQAETVMAWLKTNGRVA